MCVRAHVGPGEGRAIDHPPSTGALRQRDYVSAVHSVQVALPSWAQAYVCLTITCSARFAFLVRPDGIVGGAESLLSVNCDELLQSLDEPLVLSSHRAIQMNECRHDQNQASVRNRLGTACDVVACCLGSLIR